MSARLFNIYDIMRNSHILASIRVNVLTSISTHLPIHHFKLIFSFLLFFFSFSVPTFAEFVGIKNLKITCSKWYDTSSLKNFGESAIYIAKAETNEEKAIAVWRAIQQVTAVTNRIPSEPAYHIKYIQDPIKLLNIYGAHWCDGLSRIMIMTWRALGYRATKLYKWGHTFADCWWKDEDGIERWHLFDVSQHWFVYNRNGNHIASADEIALDFSLIYRPSKTPIPSQPSGHGLWSYVHCQHLPWPTHNTLLTLRPGESYTLFWGNKGLPYQNIFKKYKPNFRDFKHGPYPITYGNGELIYVPNLKSKDFLKQILSAQNVKITKKGVVPLSSQRAELIIKTELPHIIVCAFLKVWGKAENEKAKVAFFISTNQKKWHKIWESKKIGIFNAEIKTNLLCGFYGYYLKIVLKGQCILSGMNLKTITQHNLFALPQLWPGENLITVNGQISSSSSLEIIYNWEEKGRNRVHRAVVNKMPYSYLIVTKGKKWEHIVCKSLTIRVIPRQNNYLSPNRKKSKDLSPRIIPTSAFIGRKKCPSIKKPKFCIKAIKKELQRQGHKEYKNSAIIIRNALLDLMVTRPSEAVDVIKEVIYKDVTGNKILACQALYQIAKEHAAPVFIKILKNDPIIKWSLNDKKAESIWLHTAAVAAFILAQINTEEAKQAAPLIAELLTQKYRIYRWRELRWVWIKALATLGSEQEAKVLSKEIFSSDVDASALAIRSIGEIRDKSQLPLIIKILRQHQWPPQGIYAIGAISKLGNKDVADLVIPYLQHWDEDYRYQTAITLRRLGNKKAIPYLKEALIKENFPWVREEIKKAIESLENR